MAEGVRCVSGVGKRRSRRLEATTKEVTRMGDRGGGIYIGGGAITLIIIVVLLIWLL